eukprot:GILK01010755.1.p1 GENE.GILK01010755.1~~GILK01010755.1.p1  ORF type:complete len:286 (+),score=37.41 GILK01010755.1:53-859(+)
MASTDSKAVAKPPPAPAVTLLVKDIPPGTTREELIAEFGKYGDVKDLRFPKTRNSSIIQSLIDFGTVREADAAVAALNNKPCMALGNAVLSVRISKISQQLVTEGTAANEKEKEDEQHAETGNTPSASPAGPVNVINMLLDGSTPKLLAGIPIGKKSHSPLDSTKTTGGPARGHPAPHPISSLTQAPMVDTTKRKAAEVFRKPSDDPKYQQAKKAAQQQAQSRPGHYAVHDSIFNNFLIPVLPPTVTGPRDASPSSASAHNGKKIRTV